MTNTKKNEIKENELNPTKNEQFFLTSKLQTCIIILTFFAFIFASFNRKNGLDKKLL